MLHARAQRTGPLTRLATLTALTVILAGSLTGAALAQDAGADADADTDAAPAENAATDAPVAPASLESCGAERCLEVGFSPDLAGLLSGAGGATLDQVAAGLTFDYRGPDPVRVYFVAARYDNDRLVRYEVAPAITIQPGAAEIPGIADVLTHALSPRTEHSLRLAEPEATIGAIHPDLPAEAFVGSMPANTLMEFLRPELEEPLDARARAAIGSVAVLALIPRDAELRAAPNGKSVGATLRLHYE